MNGEVIDLPCRDPWGSIFFGERGFTSFWRTRLTFFPVAMAIKSVHMRKPFKLNDSSEQDSGGCVDDNQYPALLVRIDDNCVYDDGNEEEY